MEESSNIGVATISPGAEPRTDARATVSGQQEGQFFSKGRQEYLLEQNKLNMGWLGKFFGCGPSAASNIAGLIAILSLLAFVGTLLMPAPPPEGVRTLLMGLATTSLGYLFGASTKSGKGE